MEINPIIINYYQPALLNIGEVSSGIAELFPRVWRALEALVDPLTQDRQPVLDWLVDSNAARFSPLVIYMLTTRLQDPEPGIRSNVLKILAGVLVPDENGLLAPESVRQFLLFHFSRIQKTDVYTLLDLINIDPTNEPYAILVCKSSHRIGDYLIEILSERKESLVIRKQAALVIGKVGYIDAIPIIERLIMRLESRVNGQQSMLYSSMDGSEEINLLPTLKSVLNALQAP